METAVATTTVPAVATTTVPAQFAYRLWFA